MYQAIIDFDHLVGSYQAARLGKRYRGEVVRFTAHLEERLLNLHNHLVWETWGPSPAREFVVMEPKMRRIQAPPFEDRIVHHALVDRVQPLFEQRFIHHSYACREGKGVHAAIQALQRMLRQARREWGTVYVVQADVRQFFASIDHEQAMQAVSAVVDCAQTLGLWWRILQGYGHDDGFGLPVGALTSQLTANVQLDGVDHQMTDDYGAGRYLRYMDDIIILQPSKSAARHRLAQLNYAVTQRGLTLNPKTHVRPASAGVDWCGYRTWATHILPRKRNIKRARRRIAKISADYRQGRVDLPEVADQVNSLLAYAKHCDSHRTIHSILDQMDLRRIPREPIEHDDAIHRPA